VRAPLTPRPLAVRSRKLLFINGLTLWQRNRTKVRRGKGTPRDRRRGASQHYEPSSPAGAGPTASRRLLQVERRYGSGRGRGARSEGPFRPGSQGQRFRGARRRQLAAHCRLPRRYRRPECGGAAGCDRRATGPAAGDHPQINYSKVNYSKAPYAAEPYNTISYCECHDNHTLWDKLSISAKDATEDDKKKMQKLALAIVLTSQGISFLHAGTEFLRSKKGMENSFESPDSINAIDWNLKTKNNDVSDYVKALIKMRKAHPAFRMTTTKQISSGIRFVNNLPEHMVAYAVNGAAVKDAWKKIFIVYNGSANTQSINLPQGKWNLFDTNTLNNKNIAGKIEVSPWSCTICYQR